MLFGGTQIKPINSNSIYSHSKLTEGGKDFTIEEFR